MGDVLRVGKYKGKTFQEVLDTDRSYCDWVFNLTAASSTLVDFQTYLIAQGFTSTKPRFESHTASTRPRAVSAASAELTSYAASREQNPKDLPGSKKRGLDSALDTLESSVKGFGACEKKSRFSLWLEDNLEQAFEDSPPTHLQSHLSEAPAAADDAALPAFVATDDLDANLSTDVDTRAQTNETRMQTNETRMQAQEEDPWLRNSSSLSPRSLDENAIVLDLSKEDLALVCLEACSASHFKVSPSAA